MKRLIWLLPAAVLFLGGTPVFAQGPGGGSAGGTNWIAIASAFSMAIASSVCGLAQGKATASAAEGMARNPGAAAAIRLALILGLAFIESLALYTFVIIFIKVV